MLYVSEIWLLWKENGLALSRADVRMVRQIYGVKLTYKVACDELR